ncbi:MAG: hypothetical protein KDB01_23805, partial [Planctomycetaceae bacterium]|nr:hypothetical protein [Planctomycetaceae bacterium]
MWRGTADQRADHLSHEGAECHASSGYNDPLPVLRIDRMGTREFAAVEAFGSPVGGATGVQY